MKILKIILMLWTSTQIVAQFSLYYKINQDLQVSSTADDGCKRSVEFSIREVQDTEDSPEYWDVDYYMEKECNNKICTKCEFVDDRYRNDFKPNGIITRSVALKGLYGYFKTRNGGFWTSGYYEATIKPIFQIGKIMQISYNNAGAMSSFITFNGEFLYIPVSQTYPKLLTPNNSGIISGSSASLVAPDFLINNFKEADLWWEVAGSNGVVYNGRGYSAIVNMGGNSKCQTITAKVTAQNGYDWSSSIITFEFRPLPNLELGKTVLIEQPQCTEEQQALQPWKTVGYVRLANEALDKKYKITLVDKDNLLSSVTFDKVMPYKELYSESSPYKLVFEEDLGNNLTSCSQIFENIQINPAKPIELLESKFTDIRCFGEQPYYTITVDGNTNEYRFVSNDTTVTTLIVKQSQKIILKKGSMDYKFEIVDDNWCRYEQPLNFTAKEPAKLEAILKIDTALCFRGNASVQIIAKGGTIYDTINQYRYAFWPATGTQISSIFTTKGGASAYPRVYDKNNCTFSFPTTTLSNPKDFKLKVIEHKDNICPKASFGNVILGSSSEDQRYTYSYAISDRAFNRDSSFSSLSANIYKFSVQNQYGCLKDTTLQITEPPYITISKTALDSVRCFGELNGSIELHVTGGTGFKKLWKNKEPAYFPSNKAYSFNHTYDSLAGRSYWFHAQDSLGCLDSVSYAIGTMSNIHHHSSIIKPSCFESNNGQLNVYVSGGKTPYNHTWINHPELNTELLQKGLAKGTYILLSTDQLGCRKSDTIVLQAPPSLLVDLQGYPLICKGQSVELDAGVDGNRYLWSGSNGFSATSRKVTIDKAGTYWVSVRDYNSCLGSDTISFEQSDTEFKVDFLMATTVVQGDTVVLLNDNVAIDSMRWNLNPSNTQKLPSSLDFRAQEALFRDLGEQDVQLMGYYKGCRDVRTRKIRVIEPKDRNKNDQSIGIKTSVIRECRLFPNPNDGSFEVHIELNESNVPVAVILSSLASGKSIKQLDWKIYPDNKITFEEDLPEGAYVLHVKVRDEVLALRFLVAYD